MTIKPLDIDVIKKIKEELLNEKGSGDWKYTIAKDDKEMDFHIAFLNNCKKAIAQDTENNLGSDGLAETAFNLTKEELGYDIEVESYPEYFRNEIRQVLQTVLKVK